MLSSTKDPQLEERPGVARREVSEILTDGHRELLGRIAQVRRRLALQRHIRMLDAGLFMGLLLATLVLVADRLFFLGVEPAWVLPLAAGLLVTLVSLLLAQRGGVSEEAAAQGKSVEAHWAHLVVHGVLHLCGYDHEHDEAAAEMEALEERILSGLGYPGPYD